jgi:GDP-L-fucose synthase
MKVLVTGGAGFVGRAMVKRLISEGLDVTVVDPLVKATGAIHPNIWAQGFPPGKFRFVEQDCRKFFHTESAKAWDSIFHLAAIVGGRVSIEDSALHVATDLSIDAEMWNWATQNVKMKVIYFSSSAAYPISLQDIDNHRALLEGDISFTSNEIGMADLSYGWSKLTGEYLAHLANERYGIQTTIYRPFSGYGTDQDLAYPFPAILKRAKEHIPGNAFHVWGSGKQVRDFIHIDDCVEVVFKTFKHDFETLTLNLGTGVGTNFIELAHAVLSAVGKPDEVVHGTENKPEGVFSRVSNTSFQNLLMKEWRPKTLAETLLVISQQMDCKQK